MKNLVEKCVSTAVACAASSGQNSVVGCVQLRDSRLEALEADNHGDAGHDEGDDDAYNIESDAEFGVAPAKTRKTESRKHSSSATGSSSGPNW